MENHYRPVFELGWYDGPTTGISADLVGEFYAFADFYVAEDGESGDRKFAFVKCDDQALQRFRRAINEAFHGLYLDSIRTSRKVQVCEMPTVYSEIGALKDIQIAEDRVPTSQHNLEDFLTKIWNERDESE